MKKVIASSALALLLLSPIQIKADDKEEVLDILVSNYTDGKYDNDQVLVDESKYSILAIEESVVKIHLKTTYDVVSSIPGVGKMSYESFAEGIGSGVVVEVTEDKAYILTNQHMTDMFDDEILMYEFGYFYDPVSDSIENKKSIITMEETIMEVEAKVIASDTFMDAAVLEVDLEYVMPNELVKFPYEIGESRKLEPGDWMMSIGYSNGQEIQAMEGNFSRKGYPDLPNDYILTTAPAVGGNSGGPVIAIMDGKYELVGLIEAGFVSNSGFLAPYNACVPIDYFMEELIPDDLF